MSEEVPTDKPVLAVDLDEVLGEFVPQLCKFHDATYPSEPKVPVEEFFSYHFADVWKCSDEEAGRRVDAFLDSPYFLDGVPVVPGAHDGLEALRPHFKLVIVTSRQHAIEAATRAWLDKNFAGVFDTVVFGNHYGKEGVKRSKPDMCADLGAVALLDDSSKYARQCADTLERVFLFGDYAWNAIQPGEADLPATVERVASWPQAVEAILKFAGDRRDKK